MKPGHAIIIAAIIIEIALLTGVVILAMYFPDIYNEVFNKYTGFGFDFNESDLPEQDLTNTCEDYNLCEEFTTIAGVTNMLVASRFCEATNPGGWTCEDNEVSCDVNGALNVDCNAEAAQDIEFICNFLEGTYVCRPDYLGCLCNISPPSQWSNDSQPDQDGYTCGDEYTEHGDICLGTCPQGEVCMELYNIGGHTCECEEEGYEPDKTPCKNLYIPTDIGDKGGFCRDYGACDQSAPNCEHYWNWNDGIHKCDCTESTFCGQYCYVYTIEQACECPPGSILGKMAVHPNHYCVPFGCYCEFDGLEAQAGMKGTVVC